MQPRPIVTVAAVAECNGRFLIVEEHADGAVVLNQPAGRLEADETPAEAVRREVFEESGWEFEPESVVGIYLYPSPAQNVTYLRLCFSGRCVTHHPQHPLDAGILRVCWMSRAELAAQSGRLRSPLVLRCIDDFLGGVSHPLGLISRVTAASG
jgi:8-oxo-dGTP pyrophosphatase MutT (NUDIX family)